MTTRRRTVAAAVTALAFVTVACAADAEDSASGTGDGADVLTIGLVDDFSGGQSVLAEAMAEGVDQAVTQINDAGGVEALGGAKLQVERYDTESDPNTASPQATRAVDDDVDIIFGGSITDTVIAGTNVTSRAGVPWIVTGAIATEITDRGLTNVFQIAPNSDVFAESFFEAMQWGCAELGCAENPTLGLSVSDSTYGHDIASSFDGANTDHFDVVSEVAYPLSTTDLSSVAARMTSESPEVLFNAGYPADGLAIGRIFGESVDTSAKIMSSLALYSDVQDELGATAEGMLMYADVSSLFEGLPDSYTEQNQLYAEEHGHDMPYMALRGYMSVMLFNEALEQAETSDGDAVAEALHGVELSHDKGNLWTQEAVSFDADGALEESSLLFVQIQDGQTVSVYPPEFATAELRPYR